MRNNSQFSILYPETCRKVNSQFGEAFTLIELLVARHPKLQRRKAIPGFTLIELLVACHPKPWRRKAIPLGFTLIELLVVMGIFAIMVGFASINLLHPQTRANLDTTVTTLVSDLREQQTRAMTGDGASAFGVYFEANRYTLFTGSAYPGSDNFAVNLQGGITISSLVNPPPFTVVFAQRSGETSSTKSFTVRNTNSGEQKIIIINSLGAISIQ